MVWSYLQVTLRVFLKSRIYSTINIIGLALGLACCLLIMIWVQDEMSYDRFHERADRIYMVPTKLGDDILFSSTVPLLAPTLHDELPEVVNFSRMYGESLLVGVGHRVFRERIEMVDPGFLDMFDFPLEKGVARLDDPNSILLTSEMATKLFGDLDPIGQTLVIEDVHSMQVTGVLADLPKNTMMKFKILAPMMLAGRLEGLDFLNRWLDCSFDSFVELSAGADYRVLLDTIKGRIKQERPDAEEAPFLVPLTKIHLYGFEGEGRITQVRAFSLIGLLILIIASINFTNLTTARSFSRATEVGIRKVLGASRPQLLVQFFGESLLMTVIAFGLALLFVELALPGFNQITGKEIGMGSFLDWQILSWSCLVLLLTGVLSGAYPALFLSSFQPDRVLKRARNSEGGAFKQALVVAQFAISIALIIITMVIYDQIHYMRQKDVGFDKEHLLYVPLAGRWKASSTTIKKKVLANSAILAVSASSGIPTDMGYNTNSLHWEGRRPDFKPLVTFVVVDPDYSETYGMQLVEGSLLTETSPQSDIIINETFAAMLRKKSVIGTRIMSGWGDLRVAGVIKDFHFHSLERQIEPILFYRHQNPENYEYMSFRIAPQATSSALHFIEQTLQAFDASVPFSYHFMDDRLEALYRDQERFGVIVLCFSILAVAISTVGLFGLAAFMSERRTKEIGIRKVLGASLSDIVGMLTISFTRWVLMANLIAWPLAYGFLNNWLSDFPYRMELGPFPFLIAGFMALIITILTVGYQSQRAARVNPIEAIRHE